MKPWAIVAFSLAAGGCPVNSQVFNVHDVHSPLQLIRTIELPNVKGRVDHMAIDASTNHLFVAEYGNGSVDEVDLASGKLLGRISGLHEPQGVAWLPRQQEIAVASGDGAVTFYRGADREQIALVRLGDDADNVRLDSRNGDLVVGYGSGALAVIDPATHRIIHQLALPAHPEAFELLGAKVFVNVPDAHEIVVGDLDHEQVTRRLSTGRLSDNYPIALDAAASRIAIAYRLPGTLSVMDARSLGTIFSVPVCGDADDLYFQADQLIVICGSGAVELINETRGHKSTRVTTQAGARTGLLGPAGKRLVVAVPASSGPASLWVLKIE